MHSHRPQKQAGLRYYGSIVTQIVAQNAKKSKILAEKAQFLTKMAQKFEKTLRKSKPPGGAARRQHTP
jgi:hypothetical protein